MKLDTLRLRSPFFLVLMIAITPVLALLRIWHVSGEIILLGGLSWGVAVFLKIHIFRTVLHAPIEKSKRIAWTSAFNGVFSAVMELGAAAVYFRFAGALDTSEVLGFGVGAGSTEALLLSTAMRVAPDGSQRPACGWVSYAVPMERLITTLLHAGTRGLVYSSIVRRNPWPALLALSLFSVCDGVASYGKRAGWDWSAPTVLKKYYLFLLALAFCSLGLFLRLTV